MLHSVVGVIAGLVLHHLARDALYFHALEAHLLVAAEHLLMQDARLL